MFYTKKQKQKKCGASPPPGYLLGPPKGLTATSRSPPAFAKNRCTHIFSVLSPDVPYNTEQISHTYISKYNNKCNNQVILLMITDGKKYHYLAVKKLPALLRGITSNQDGDFYCLNCFYS